MTALSRLLHTPETQVPRSTSGEVNVRIDNETAANVRRVAAAGPHAIRRRLDELDHEWDMERILEVNAAIVSLVSLALGRFVRRPLYGGAGFVAGFLLQHALQGWCPPMPLLRRFRVRTAREINDERTALRILRGDFRREIQDPSQAFLMARGDGQATAG